MGTSLLGWRLLRAALGLLGLATLCGLALWRLGGGGRWLLLLLLDGRLALLLDGSLLRGRLTLGLGASPLSRRLVRLIPLILTLRLALDRRTLSGCAGGRATLSCLQLLRLFLFLFLFPFLLLLLNLFLLLNRWLLLLLLDGRLAFLLDGGLLLLLLLSRFLHLLLALLLDGSLLRGRLTLGLGASSLSGRLVRLLLVLLAVLLGALRGRSDG